MKVYVLMDFRTGKDYYTGDREKAERIAAETGLFLDSVDMQPAEALEYIDAGIVEPLTVPAAEI